MKKIMVFWIKKFIKEKCLYKGIRISECEIISCKHKEKEYSLFFYNFYVFNYYILINKNYIIIMLIFKITFNLFLLLLSL